MCAVSMVTHLGRGNLGGRTLYANAPVVFPKGIQPVDTNTNIETKEME